ncbi:phosphoribosyl-ATP diphosphatase [Blastomonas sp.]|uniref:phosphoribosyl-ATP diphosphatase n=1 Tax=Blastomonas sp. TaxID=1909299 RepID=UPI003594854C
MSSLSNQTITRLESVIAARRAAASDASYIATLSARGRSRIAQKIGEEAVETVIAAICDDSHGMVSESADLVFHLLILLADMGLSWDAVMAELDIRDGVSGLAEKASRKED